MSGRPGDGCDDPRETHPHWCGVCGAQQMFDALECAHLMIVPTCLRCGSTEWRNDIDELTVPDHREETQP